MIDTETLRRKLGYVALRAADGGLRYVRRDDLVQLAGLLEIIDAQMTSPIPRTHSGGEPRSVEPVRASDALEALARIEAAMPQGARPDDFAVVRARLMGGE